MTRTLLVVDDEPVVLDVLTAVLTSRGYSVLPAHNAVEALQLFRSHHGPIDLLLTDVVMPDMTGPDLADALAREQPGLKVLFIAGLPDTPVIRNSILARGLDLLPKPFDPRELIRRVEKVLEPPKVQIAGCEN